MDLHISGTTEHIIRSQVQSGRFPSEAAVVEKAVRRLENAPDHSTSIDPSGAGDQELQRRLFAAGLLSEIKPPITDTKPWQGREAVPIEGEPLSEMIIRERR